MIYLFICFSAPSVSPPACLRAYLPACLCVCLSFCPCVCLLVYLCACLPACVPACVPVCLSVSHSLFDIPESSLFASDMLPAINFNPYLFLIYFISYLFINLFLSFFVRLLVWLSFVRTYMPTSSLSYEHAHPMHCSQLHTYHATSYSQVTTSLCSCPRPYVP